MSEREDLEGVNRVLFKYDQFPSETFGVRGALAELYSEGWRNTSELNPEAIVLAAFARLRSGSIYSNDFAGGFKAAVDTVLEILDTK